MCIWLYYGMRLRYMCACVSVFVCFSLNFFDIFKGDEQSKNCKFSNKHDDLEWFPFQTIKPVTKNFEKFHVLIKLLIFVKFQNTKFQVYITHPTNLTSYL